MMPDTGVSADAAGTTMTVSNGTLSVVAVGIMLFTGWKGGEMVFRHHVGAVDEQP